ncbi:MAG: hypothetical protein J5674_04600 [Candidatus Methanomethylophilaceae archaeon]|nr:hypothetical protein [Candidatus Methanomethylophilaceae archaeon]
MILRPVPSTPYSGRRVPEGAKTPTVTIRPHLNTKSIPLSGRTRDIRLRETDSNGTRSSSESAGGLQHT